MILLDTHAWVWWLTAPRRLSAKARAAIRDNLAGDGVSVSCFSTWEIAMLVARGRLTLSLNLDQWLAECERIGGLRFAPVTNPIVCHAVNLPGSFHADPADRIIVATARLTGAWLITGDEKILGYPHVKTLW